MVLRSVGSRALVTHIGHARGTWDTRIRVYRNRSPSPNLDHTTWCLTRKELWPNNERPQNTRAFGCQGAWGKGACTLWPNAHASPVQEAMHGVHALCTIVKIGQQLACRHS